MWGSVWVQYDRCNTVWLCRVKNWLIHSKLTQKLESKHWLKALSFLLFATAQHWIFYIFYSNNKRKDKVSYNKCSLKMFLHVSAYLFLILRAAEEVFLFSEHQHWEWPLLADFRANGEIKGREGGGKAGSLYYISSEGQLPTILGPALTQLSCETSAQASDEIAQDVRKSV